MSTWVLLRGLARESRHWGELLPALRQGVPAGDAVVALDLPGNGTRWREPSPANVAQMVAAARAALAEAGHAPPYLLVALSLGGMTALAWAAQAPGELRGCALVNTSLGGLSPFWQRLRPDAWPTLLWSIAPGRTAIERERAILRLTSNLPVSSGTLQAWADVARAHPVSTANALRQIVAAARFRAPARPPPVPLLLLASRRDRLASVRCSRAIAAAWDVPLHEHPSAGHDLALDDPRWLVARLLAWESALPQRHETATDLP